MKLLRVGTSSVSYSYAVLVTNLVAHATMRCCQAIKLTRLQGLIIVSLAALNLVLVVLVLKSTNKVVDTVMWLG